MHDVHALVSELASADGQQQLDERQLLPHVDIVLGILESEPRYAQSQLSRLPQQLGAL